MKLLVISALVATGLAATVTAASADVIPDDFWAIQRGEPYAGAPARVVPAVETATPAKHYAHRVYLSSDEKVYPKHRRVIRKTDDN